jgi:4-alpha-glucanotransferase
LNKFHLVLLIHSHQPIGNFDAVIEHTYQRSYLPFVQALLSHPSIRLGLHYSGPLLEWCERHHPEFFDHLRELIGRGQVELAGGGFYEPILVSVPPQDQAEQIRLMRDYLAQKFGRRPVGAWLAERVWEPQLPYALASAGVEYTLVDDVHFLAAGFELDQLHGDYACEERGRTVRVFPGLKALRYLLPFRSPEEALAFLGESAARHPAGMAAMGDDCEKFGAWPATYDHCYRDGWVARFFEALEKSSDWLVTTPPGEYIRNHPSLGRADLPSASYSEMMEWALPTTARTEFRKLSQQFAHRPDVQRFLRGGAWRGFFSKYPEANLLHKKMLHVSQMYEGFRSKRMGKQKRDTYARARKHLLRAQCNDAYWHGVFGGLYAPHLRTELWRELVRAEALLAELDSKRGDALRIELLDFDADGSQELYVTSRRMAALLRPADGGTLAALDFRPAGVTLINSMQRRMEAYHSRLREGAHGGSGQVASIHDQVRCKEDGLERFLRYDRWPRNSFRLLLFSTEKTFEDYQELRLDEHPLLAAGPYAVVETGTDAVSLACEAPLASNSMVSDSAELIRCAKRFVFRQDGAGYRMDCATNLSCAHTQSRRAQVGLEIVINLLAPREPDRYFETFSGRYPLAWSAAIPATEGEPMRLRAVDEWQNVAVTIDAPGASKFWVAPIETVSESEEGFERVYQGSQILIVYPLELFAAAPWSRVVSLHVEPARPDESARARR